MLYEYLEVVKQVSIQKGHKVMAELLTKDIVSEYQKRAARLPDQSLQDAGERRKLRIELQKKCGLTELEAINILNGYSIDDYIAKYTRRAYEHAANQVRE